jgi:hypothetical protein
VTERLYSVIVSQEFYREFEVKASSKKVARDLIEEMTFGRIDDDDPRISHRIATGTVGSEKIRRVAWLR